MSKPLDVNGVLKMIKDKEVKYVDLRFTDPRGKMQHLTMDVSQMGEDAWADGLMFDGSSIAGWKAINESDMVLMPDPSSAHMDPFYAQTTMSVFCDILDPGTGEGYARDPRMIAKRTEAYLKSTKIGDTVFVGPGPRLRDRQHGPPHAHQGRLLPGEPDGLGPGHALGNALGHGRDGPHRREAPPRGGLLAA